VFLEIVLVIVCMWRKRNGIARMLMARAVCGAPCIDLFATKSPSHASKTKFAQ
jgi:hypothetical protein